MDLNKLENAKTTCEFKCGDLPTSTVLMKSGISSSLQLNGSQATSSGRSHRLEPSAQAIASDTFHFSLKQNGLYHPFLSLCVNTSYHNHIEVLSNHIGKPHQLSWYHRDYCIWADMFGPLHQCCLFKKMEHSNQFIFLVKIQDTWGYFAGSAWFPPMQTPTFINSRVIHKSSAPFISILGQDIRARVISHHVVRTDKWKNTFFMVPFLIICTFSGAICNEIYLSE